MRKHKLYNATNDDQIKDYFIRDLLLMQSSSNPKSIFDCNSHNNPSELSGESYIALKQFTVDSLNLQFKKEMCFTVSKDESGQYYCVLVPEHNLDVIARSESDLVEEIKVAYAYMWEQFVKAEESILTPDAQKLAEVLREVLEVVS
jgi:hypothetical protein